MKVTIKNTVSVAGVLLLFCAMCIVGAVCVESITSMWDQNEQAKALVVFMGLLTLLFSIPCCMLVMKTTLADEIAAPSLQ